MVGDMDALWTLAWTPSDHTPTEWLGDMDALWTLYGRSMDAGLDPI